MPAIHILFDADGVLVDSQPPMIEKARSFYGVDFHYEDWTGFSTLYDLVISRTGADPQAVAKQLFSIEVVNRGLPTPGSREAIERLLNLNFVPIVATGRPDDQTDGTVDWFYRYFGGLIDAENIFLRPPGVSTFEFKREVLLRHKAIALVEDSLELMTSASADPALAAVLLALVDRPWNQSEAFPENTYRMRIGNYAMDDLGWSAFINRIKSLS